MCVAISIQQFKGFIRAAFESTLNAILIAFQLLNNSLCLELIIY